MSKRSVLIIGGGAIGSAIAAHLARLPEGQSHSITVLERDASYAQASSSLSGRNHRPEGSISRGLPGAFSGLRNT